MNDPYQVLEIQPSASDEQVKAAYLNMQKKYHPDNYENGPLKDLAVEKTQQITDAFDEIMNTRRKEQVQSQPSVSVTSTSETDEQAQTKTSATDLAYIKTLLDQNQLVEAENILDRIALEQRTAEWYFLKGRVFFSRGWMDDAANFFSTAVRMDPKNEEYRSALNQISWQRQGNYGSPNQGPYRQPNSPMASCSLCDVCSGLLCADCCCECAGGDCIPGC